MYECECICVLLQAAFQLWSYLQNPCFFASEVAACIRKWERFSHENANAASQQAVRVEIARAITIAKAAKAAAATEHSKAAAEQRMQEPLANVEFSLKGSHVLKLMR